MKIGRRRVGLKLVFKEWKKLGRRGANKDVRKSEEIEMVEVKLQERIKFLKIERDQAL